MERPGSNAEYVRAPARVLFHLPPSMSHAAGSLVCDLLAVAVHAVGRPMLLDGMRVLVLGAGPIGLMIGEVLRCRGIRDVAFSDPSPERRRLARHMFSFRTLSVKEPREFSPDFDVVFEASGSPRAWPVGYKSLRRGGQMVIVGVPEPTVQLPAVKWLSRELSLFGSFDFTAGDVDQALGLCLDGKIELERIVTHQMPLSEGRRAFSLQAGRKAGRIVLEP